MTKIEVVDDTLKIEVLGWDKLWSFKSRLEFPLGHVVKVRRWERELDRFKWLTLRAPGTSLPGVITAGTYHRKGEHMFYAVHKFARALVIELKDEWYSRVVVEVEDPDAVLKLFLGQAALVPEVVTV